MTTYTQHQMFHVDLPIHIQATTAKRTPAKNAITHKGINIVRHFQALLLRSVFGPCNSLQREKQET